MTLNTSQQIRHVFICSGLTQHVHLGMRVTNDGRCPTCGASVTECTDAPIGKYYLAHVEITNERFKHNITRTIGAT